MTSDCKNPSASKQICDKGARTRSNVNTTTEKKKTNHEQGRELVLVRTRPALRTRSRPNENASADVSGQWRIIPSFVIIIDLQYNNHLTCPEVCRREKPETERDAGLELAPEVGVTIPTGVGCERLLEKEQHSTLGSRYAVHGLTLFTPKFKRCNPPTI